MKCIIILASGIMTFTLTTSKKILKCFGKWRGLSQRQSFTILSIFQFKTTGID